MLEALGLGVSELRERGQGRRCTLPSGGDASVCPETPGQRRRKRMHRQVFLGEKGAAQSPEPLPPAAGKDWGNGFPFRCPDWEGLRREGKRELSLGWSQMELYQSEWSRREGGILRRKQLKKGDNETLFRVGWGMGWSPVCFISASSSHLWSMSGFCRLDGKTHSLMLAQCRGTHSGC